MPRRAWRTRDPCRTSYEEEDTCVSYEEEDTCRGGRGGRGILAGPAPCSPFVALPLRAAPPIVYIHNSKEKEKKKKKKKTVALPPRAAPPIVYIHNSKRINFFTSAKLAFCYTCVSYEDEDTRVSYEEEDTYPRQTCFLLRFL